MSYTPPPGSAVVLTFVDPYSPPPGGSVTLEFAPVAGAVIQPPSIDDSAVGTPFVAFPQIVDLDRNHDGIPPETAVGTPTAAYPLHAPEGFDSSVFGTAFVWLKTQWVRPLSIDSLTWTGPFVGDPAYFWLIPSGDNLILDFVDPYEPPDGGSLVLEFFPGAVPKIRPYGPDLLEFGEHMISLLHRPLPLGGIDSLKIGALTIYNSQQAIRPESFAFEVVSQPSLMVMRRYIFCYPTFDSLNMTPAPDTEDQMRVKSSIGPMQRVLPLSFNLTEIVGGKERIIGVGDPHIAFWTRYITFLTKPTTESTQWGDPTLSDSPRYIFVPWSSFTQWGRPEFGWTGELGPHGIPPPDVPVPDIKLGSLRQMEGFEDSVFGDHEVKSMRRYVTVWPWTEPDPATIPVVLNKTRYVLHVNSQEFEPYPWVSIAVKIQLRDIYVRPVGIDPPRFDNYHYVWSTGQQVLPVGDENTQWGDAMVSHRVRHVYPTWRFAGFFDPFHHVRNAAIQISPSGWESHAFTDLYPNTRVWFNAQTIKPYYVLQEGYGTPFVAFGIRLLLQTNPEYSFKPGTPWVSASPRIVDETPWLFEYKFGSPTLRTFRLTIRASPITSDTVYGVARVKNVTPQLYPSMASTEVVETPWVSRSPRTLTAEGKYSFVSGEHSVVFRDRWMHVPGWLSLFVPNPTVRQEIDSPYVTQRVFPVGIPPEEPFLGPEFRGNPLPMGWDSMEFSAETWIRVQGCTPHWYYPETERQIGFPTIVFTQTIVQDNEDYSGGDGSQLKMNPQRVDPHTIWARIDTPVQAQRNHPGTFLFYPVDLYSNPGDLGLPPWFGLARVHSPITDTIFHNHNRDSLGHLDETTGGWVSEDAQVVSTKQEIVVGGYNGLRMGFPFLNRPGKLFVISCGQSPEFTEEILHKVGIPPEATQWIKPSGWLSQTFPSPPHEVQLKNRRIYPVGYSNTFFGNNQPMVYHYPRGPSEVGAGNDFTEWGDAWVSHYVRTFDFDGWDSLTMGYTFDQFEERMRVTRGHPPEAFGAGDQLQMGYPDVSMAGFPQHIGPYMIPPPEYCHPHDVALEEA